MWRWLGETVSGSYWRAVAAIRRRLDERRAERELREAVRARMVRIGLMQGREPGTGWWS
jgi:hypothetical protein